MKIVLNHFEHGEKVFTNQHEFISFVQKIASENEDDLVLETVDSCISYVKGYCDNFEVVEPR